MALAHAAGIALPLAGFSPPRPLLLLLLLPALLLLWRRPWPVGVLLVAAMAGLASGAAAIAAEARDCRRTLPDGWEGQVEGRFLTRVLPGRAVPFRIESGAPADCRAEVRALLPRDAPVPPTGRRIALDVRWEGRAFVGPREGAWAGRFRASGGWTPASGGGPFGAVLAVRGAIQDRMARLWGLDGAPVIEALVLARREHLDPELREAFGVSGTAHLLAISGFHVGVVAGLLFGLLRALGVRRRRAEGAAAMACWVYVLAIGVPQAAARAALLLTLLVVARLRGRPVVPAGALAAALLLLLLVRPEWLASVGFQLSFAGTAGLVLLRRPAEALVEALHRRLTGRGTPRRRDRGHGAELVRGGTRGLAAGIAATLPTLPLLAWHFDRISLAGIPATLVLAPIVAAAIPGIGVALLVSFASESLGAFLAGGPGLLLEAVGRFVTWIAELPGASPWVSRPALLAAMGGGTVAHVLLRRGAPGRVRSPVRAGVAGGAGLALALLAPLLPGRGGLEVHLIDVGQGDAVALRAPPGRWLLVDAGPRSASFDAGSRRVVPYLRRVGVRELEALVLTHPHLDHIGGAPAVLEGLPVRGILDPSRPHGSAPYLALIQSAAHAGVWWWEGTAGGGFRLGEATVRILHPDRDTRDEPHLADPNDLSIILLVEWRGQRILLTGDAPAAVERAILAEVGPLALLKVGHHGSRTSTSPELLAEARPAIALVGVGDPNGFGHPHPVVLDRLAEAGTAIYRTDRDGNVRVRLDADRGVRVEVGR